MDEEVKLTALLRQLPQVESPADFDQNVRSRIARKSKPRSRAWAGLRVALPATGMALIIAAVVLNSDVFYPSGPEPDSRVEIVGDPAKNPVFKIEEVKEGQDADEAERRSVAKPREGTSRQPESRIVAAKPREIESKDSGNRASRDPNAPTIRSIDQGAEEAIVSNPPGIDPDKKVTERDPVPAKQFSAIEVLSALGIRSSWERGRLVVSSVSSGSIGATSGIRKGDQVIAIDGLKVSQKPIGRGVVSGRTLLILRSGRQITVSVRSGQ